MAVYKDKNPTKDGRQYYFYVSWVDATGKKRQYRSRKYAMRSDCVNAETDFRLSIRKYVPASFTFDEMIREYISEKEKVVKPSTLANIKNCLSHTSLCLGKIKISKLNNNQYERFLAYLEAEDMKNHRRNRIIEYTRAVCNFAFKRYGIYTPIPERYDKYNERADMPVYKMEFWTPKQFNTFISVVDDMMYRALFTLLFSTGMRSGEALALHWQDIDFQTGNISITKTANTKLGQTVLLTPKTRSSIRTIKAPKIALERLFELYEHSVVPIKKRAETFVFGTDRAIPNTTLQHYKHRYYLKAKEIDPTLPEIRVHSLRHSCASALINSGATIVYISKYLGHSSTKETLDTYAHFFPNETDIIAEKMNELL